MTVQPIQWPSISVGGHTYILRISYAAHFQLSRWGMHIGQSVTLKGENGAADVTLKSAGPLDIAAASAGTFDGAGKWHSTGFERAIDFADLVTTEEEGVQIMTGVMEAIKKAYPELTISAQAVPAETNSAA